MDRLDVCGEPEYGGEHSCVIGKSKPRKAPEPYQGSIAPSKDEVGERCKQDTAHSHWGRRIERATVSRYQLLNERKASGELLERGPKIPAYRSLLLLDVLNGGPIPPSDTFTSGDKCWHTQICRQPAVYKQGTAWRNNERNARSCSSTSKVLMSFYVSIFGRVEHLQELMRQAPLSLPPEQHSLRVP